MGWRFIPSLVLLCLAVSALGQPPSNVSPRYTVTDLGKPGTYSEAEALNDKGQVVGWQGGGDRVLAAEAFLWQARRQQIITKQPYDAAYGISEDGEVVGVPDELHIIGYGAFDILSGSSAFLWNQGDAIDLGGFSDAYAINNTGEAAGESAHHAVVWQRREVVGLLVARPDVVWAGVWSHRVGSLPDYPYSVAYGLNDASEAVGVALKDLNNVPQNGRAFAAVGGQMRLLKQPAAGNSVAYAVNASGAVAGTFRPRGGKWQAAFWEASSGVALLPLPPGDVSAEAHGINADGEIVGWASQTQAAPGFDGFGVGSTSRRACLWSGGKAYALNDLLPANSGWDLQEAKAINAAGWIVGGGTVHGEYHAFLLTPVKSP